MASVNVVVGSDPKDFECDTTQRTATLNEPGGMVSNSGDVDAVINVNGGTISSYTTPLDAGSILVPVGSSVLLGRHCKSFEFRSSAATRLVVTRG